MARRTRRKYWKKRGRWSANIRQVVNNTIAMATGDFFGTLELATNPVQSSSTVSQQYTVKNVEFTFQIEYYGSSNERNGIESLCAYIMYLPQGMTVTSSYVRQHPEYIMAYRFLGSPDYENNYSSSPNFQTNSYRNPLRIKTRLARRLQTGDSIIFLVTGNNSTGASGTGYEVVVNGLIRWWTKAN